MGKENKRQKEQTTKHKFTKLADQSENFGKKGRPKKLTENKKEARVFEKQFWFNNQRSSQILTLVCEKGSLALRYKTGQRSNQIDENTKSKKDEETKKLKTKLKELKRACEYSDKIPYLLIDNNEAAEPMAVENPAHEEILNEVNTLFKFLHPEFIPTMKLIIERTLAIEQGEPSMLATQICEVIQEHPASHKMILNLALIKTNIEEDLEYVLKLANAQETDPNHTVQQLWVNDAAKKKEWLEQFVGQIVKILQEKP